MTPPARQPVVVKIGGSALGAGPRLWHALAEMHTRTPLVLVHGGGAAVDDHLRRLGQQPVKHDGIRITPPEQIAEVVAVLAGRTNAEVCGRLIAAGIAPRPVGLTLAAGGVLHATTAEGPAGVDLGRVGRAELGDPLLAERLIGAGFPLVFSSIGLDDAGQPLNINADDAAIAIAELVRPSELVFLSDVPGVLDAAGGVILELGPPPTDRLGSPGAADPEGLIASGVISGGMIPKVRACQHAADRLGLPTRIAPWADPDRPGTTFRPRTSPTPHTAAAGLTPGATPC